MAVLPAFGKIQAAGDKHYNKTYQAYKRNNGKHPQSIWQDLFSINMVNIDLIHLKKWTLNLIDLIIRNRCDNMKNIVCYNRYASTRTR